MQSVNKVILLGNLTRARSSGTRSITKLSVPLAWQQTGTGQLRPARNGKNQSITGLLRGIGRLSFAASTRAKAEKSMLRDGCKPEALPQKTAQKSLQQKLLWMICYCLIRCLRQSGKR
jgi:hypothetical protein